MHAIPVLLALPPNMLFTPLFLLFAPPFMIFAPLSIGGVRGVRQQERVGDYCVSM